MTATILKERWVSQLDQAVEQLRERAAELEDDDPMRPRVEAAWDRLASYAMAVRDLAEAGVSSERVAAVIDRAWRDIELTVMAPT